jgi:hypothetical protein
MKDDFMILAKRMEQNLVCFGIILKCSQCKTKIIVPFSFNYAFMSKTLCIAVLFQICEIFSVCHRKKVLPTGSLLQYPQLLLIWQPIGWVLTLCSCILAPISELDQHNHELLYKMAFFDETPDDNFELRYSHGLANFLKFFL